jgi:secretion/DNA translocation related TadE-like protein
VTRPALVTREPSRPASDRLDRGAGTVLALGLISVVIALAGLVTSVGASVVARHRAEAAADLAALAAASATPEGEEALLSAASSLVTAADCGRAGAVASSGGASLTRCQGLDDGSVVVEVAVPVPVLDHLIRPQDRPTARARARAGPPKEPGAGGAAGRHEWRYR